MTVPLAVRRLPPNARLRRLVADLVQLRPILEDENRELLLDLDGEPLQLVRFAAPEPDAERPLLFEGELDLGRDVTAHVVVCRAAQPIPLNPARAARRGGLLVRSGRAAHEITLAGLEGRTAPATSSARFAARRSSSCSARRSTHLGRRSWCASIAAA